MKILKQVEMAKVRMNFSNECIEDIVGEITLALNSTNIFSNIQSGDKIGILIGSRGISSIVDVLQSVIWEVKKAGGNPFVLAAMGSHGGGTAEGQRKILSSLGLSCDHLGVPLITGSESLRIGYTKEGVPVYCLKHVLEMDHLLAINRIKPHTSFHGPVESGIAKMLTIGIGGPTGARFIHKNYQGNMSLSIIKSAEVILENLPILGGIALIENAYGMLAKLEVLHAKEILQKEQLLLKEAKNLMPYLPFKDIDVLIVKEIGKCYSGTGMDTNIIGRMRTGENIDNNYPNIKRIVVLDLAEASCGNANGIGLADFTTRKLIKKIDFHATYLNCYTTGFLQRAMIPMVMKNDREAIAAALESINGNNIKVITIKNTMELEELWISKAYEDRLSEINNISQKGSWQLLRFTEEGELVL